LLELTLRWAGPLAACLAMSACGADQSPAGQAPGFPIQGPGLAPEPSGAPEISGRPDLDAIVGSHWSFQPSAADPDNDLLIYSVENAPSWTAFHPGNGLLEGTPGDEDVATWEDIVISVSDGIHAAELPAFSLKVHARDAVRGNATLSWQPPLERVDGSPVGPLSGYRILYGRTPRNYMWSAEITNPSITRFVVDNLTPGRWYFAIIAVTTDGLESEPSAEVSKRIGS
jgi:hypothetical protein